jgi:hypothetical protein
MQMGAVIRSETSGEFQRTIRRYIVEYRTFHNHRCEDLKPYILKL